jgi:hypothetical protein
MDINNDFKLKYLKYKNKYLSLRDKYLNIFDGIDNPKDYQTSNKNKYLSLRDELIKNELSGGANCPRIGFSQHIGECWNDSFSMIMLYSDNLSEPIQQLFDNDFLWNGKYDPNELWFEYINDFEHNKHLLPPNIETREDFNKFLIEGKLYIEHLFNRYHNDKKPKGLIINPNISTIDPDLLKPQLSELLNVPKHLSKIYIYFLKEYNKESTINKEEIKEKLDMLLKQIQEYKMKNSKQILPPTLPIQIIRPRSNSIDMSLKCVEHSFNISDINKIENINALGGGIINIILNLSIINYFLIGYYYKYIKKVQYKKSIRKELKLTNYYINYDTIDINNHNTLEKLLHINDNLIANKYHGAYIITNNNNIIDAIHAQAFITCTNKNFFYDNNSTTDNLQEPLRSFNWKEYLMNAFEIAYTSGTNVDLSDIYNLVGKEYLEGFKIESILFFHNNGTIEDFSSNIIDPEIIFFINYNNSTIINQYTKYINNININDNLINIYILTIITFSNWKLLDNIYNTKNEQLILKIKAILSKYMSFFSVKFPDKIKIITKYINS